MSQLVALSEKRQYGDLFRFELAWNAPDHEPLTVTVGDGQSVVATNVASYRGLRVWETPNLLDSNGMAAVDRAVARTTNDRLVIFHDAAEQIWQWPSRTTKGNTVVSRPARHRHRTGSADPKFADKLEAIRLPMDVRLEVVEVLERVRQAFNTETKNETKRASKLMVKLYSAIEKQYPAGYNAEQRDHEISVSLARVLFLLFGDDTEMWTTEQFQDFIKDHTARDGSDIGQRVNRLFEILNRAPTNRAGWPPELTAFPYVNGGIFAEPINLPSLDQAFRDAVLEACEVDWSTISPAIFGSMFQSVRDAKTRRELGEHYTSEENIKKTLDPLFLDDLRAEFAACLGRDTDRKKLNSLHTLWDRLGAIRFMDPACGCGNFIITAYKQLRLIELDVMFAIQELEGYSQLSFDPKLALKVSLENFYGIEIDEWPARIAETAMYLVDRQCDLQLAERFGEPPNRLPIERQANIKVGNALQLDWKSFCPPSENTIIAGNPPFLGDSTRTRAQLADLQTAWGGNKVLSRMDYVTGWHAKTLDYYGDIDSAWAFVTTNSISQGDGVPRLFGEIFERRWQIKFAHRTFAWSSEASGAAAVHCVIVGFTRNPDRLRGLYSYTNPAGAPVLERVPFINAYLLNGPNVLVEKRTKPLHVGLPQAPKGSEPAEGGWLLVDSAAYDEVAADPIARKYLRPFRGARELLWNEERWCLWLVDSTAEERSSSPILRDRIEEVRKARASSRSPIVQESAAYPHLFRIIKQPNTAYVCIPRHVSESREIFPVAHFDPEVICGDANSLAKDPDGYLFALISSRMFLAWQKAVGGRLESRLRFGSTLTWNTFPLPEVSEAKRQQIIAAGEGVLAARALTPDLSLGELYAPGKTPEAVRTAHAALDREVDGAFGARKPIEAEERRLELLFASYQKLTGEGELF